MRRLWAIKSPSGEVYTRGGALLVHENRAELEFLFPNNEAVEVTDSVLPKTPWREHPGMASVRFPLKREDFR